MTKYLTFSGKAFYCRPWPEQIDREYEDEKRGGNWAIKMIVEDAELKKFNALGSKAKAKRIDELKKTDGFEDYLDKKFLTFRRYERLSNGSVLGPLKVEGVDPGTAIGNLSDITVDVEVYSTEYKGKPVVGIRLVSMRVDTLIPYVKSDVVPADADAPPVH